jgi:hypothetical protein
MIHLSFSFTSFAPKRSETPERSDSPHRSAPSQRPKAPARCQGLQGEKGVGEGGVGSLR